MHAPPIAPGAAAHGVHPEPPWFLKQFFFFLLGLLALIKIIPPIGPVVLGCVALYALRGAKESVQALTLLAFFLILDKAIVPINVSALRWVILFAAFGRMMADSFAQGAPTPRFFKPLLLFTGVIVILAWTTSVIPSISIFKALSFAIGVGTIMAGFYRTPHLRLYWMSWFLTLAVFILLTSMILYIFGLGYGLRAEGFQGILNHPQTYGAILAPFAAFATGLFFFQGNRSRLIMLVAGLSWIGVYLSLSRTSFLAILLALIVAVLVSLFARQGWQQSIQRALAQGSTIAIIGVFLVVTVAQWSSIQEGLTAFLLKDDAVQETEGNAIIASLEDSRGNLVERSMRNFHRAPLTGIGFGIPTYAASNPEYFEVNVVQTGFMGIPIGASVEKGFMPSAVLEETGIIGACLVLLMLFMLALPILQRGTITLFWTLMTCVLINGGEMIFFSMGGNGLFLWLLMSLCYTYATFEPSPALQRVRR